MVDVSEREVIDTFQNGLFDRKNFTDFGRQCPQDVKALKDMGARVGG